MASAREELSWKLSTHQHKHWTRDTGWLTLSTYVLNGREAGDQRRRWTKPESHSPRHKSKNLTDIFKPLFLCRENIALVTQGQASFHLHRRSVVSRHFSSPSFFQSFSLLPTFNALHSMAPSHPGRGDLSPPHLPHSRPVFLTVFSSLALIVNIFPAFLPSLPPSIPWPSVGG